MSAFDVGSDGLAPPDEPPCAECEHRAAAAKHEGKAGFIICASCAAKRAIKRRLLDCVECGSNDGTHYPQCSREGGGTFGHKLSPAQATANYKAPTRVIIESPFGKREDGSTCTPEEIAENLRYFWRCVKDSLSRNEAPFGSHGFYPNVLDDATPEERRRGIEAGFAGARAAELRCFYVDRGITPGMRDGRSNALANNQRIEIRRIE